VPTDPTGTPSSCREPNTCGGSGSTLTRCTWTRAGPPAIAPPAAITVWPGTRASPTAPPGSRAERQPEHFDIESPYHQQKASAVTGLKNIAQEGGLTLPHLALSFVLKHPAVTSALVGPRTVEQLGDLLGAENMSLTTEALAQIDDLVKPGETINMHDAGQSPPELPLSA
jgi:hypothetical protein